MDVFKAIEPRTAAEWLTNAERLERMASQIETSPDLKSKLLSAAAEARLRAAEAEA